MNVRSEFRLAILAERMLEERRQRSSIGIDELLGEPAWDILLFLYLEGYEAAEPLSKAAFHAAGVPQTSGLRYLSALEKAGLIDRLREGRCTMLRLSGKGRQRMEEYLLGVYETRRVGARGCRKPDSLR